MSRRVPFDRTARARELRTNATRHERKLWAIISRLRPKFTRQLPIGPYIADFACRQAKLVIELDGSQHAESERDKRRDAFLAEEGWAVLRFWNNELDGNADGVFEVIVNRAAECLGGTHAQPSLPGRGDDGVHDARTHRKRLTSDFDQWRPFFGCAQIAAPCL
jgi:very-short-patch-repair endonuclease